MQLVAYGAQDVYLTGNPQITFFKVVYRRHTNFSVEVIELPLNSSPDFGRKTTVTVTRNGDLVTKMYIKVTLASLTQTTNWAYVPRLGHALINYVDVEIGGSRIDRQYGTWLDIWYDLSHPFGQESGYNAMIGNVPAMTGMALSHPEYTVYVPLQFWFNRNNGLALPLIALQYHEVRINMEFNNANTLVSYNTTGSTAAPAIVMSDASLLIDYVFLDSEERRRFAQVGHEYLIEQLQFTNAETASDVNSRYRLNFNHPTKELIWVAQSGKYITSQTFLGETVDDVAATVVLSRYAVVGNGGIVSTASTLSNWIYVTDGAGATTATGGTGSGTGNGTTQDASNLVLFDGLTVTTAAATTSSPGLLFLPKANWPAFRVTYTDPITGNSDTVDLQTLINYSVTDVSGTTTTNATPSVTFTVTSVDHNIIVQQISTPLSSMTDNRVANTSTVIYGSPLGSGVVVNQFSNYGTYIDGSVNPCSTALIQLNGHDRFDTQPGAYFNYLMPWECHTNSPPDGVNVYSFALAPEQHQPTGSCNLSRIDSTLLNVTYNSDFAGDSTSIASIYAYSYNVLRVMSGMAGVAYAN